MAIREGIWRGRWFGGPQPVIEVHRDVYEDDDEDEDATFVYASEEDDEPLEYQFDDFKDESDQQDVEMKDDSEEPDEDDFIYDDFVAKLKVDLFKAPIEEQFVPLSRAQDEARERETRKGTAGYSYLDEQNFEHIAGPNCRNTNGYHGHAISVEEMRNCYTFQGLIRKSRDWVPASDDEDFELESNYFLSGICGHMPSTHAGYLPEVTPPRHGHAEVMPFGWPVRDVCLSSPS